MSLEDWIRSFPVITRTYITGSLLTTAACSIELLSPFQLYFSPNLIIYKHQYWRILTNFFFFGSSFSLDWLFHMFFLVRYCRALEEGNYRNRSADFLYMIILGSLILLVISPLIQLQFLGSSLTAMMVYIWARRNPFARMNFLGLFSFTAPYLPYVLLCLSAVLGHDVTVEIAGILVGHFYYFCEDVYPLIIQSRYRLLKTPWLLLHLFHEDIPLNNINNNNHANINNQEAVNHHHHHPVAHGFDEDIIQQGEAANNLNNHANPPQNNNEVAVGAG
jgi:Derlin-2/3